jgi:hypothetical protein
LNPIGNGIDGAAVSLSVACAIIIVVVAAIRAQRFVHV